MGKVVLIDRRINDLEPIFSYDLNAIPGINIATPALLRDILAPFFTVALETFITLDGETIDGVVVELGKIGVITILILGPKQFLSQPLEPKVVVLENNLPYKSLREVMPDLTEPIKQFFVKPDQRFVTVKSYAFDLARKFALPLFQKELGQARNPVQVLSLINKEMSNPESVYKHPACFVGNIMIPTELALLYLGAERDENPRIGFTYLGKEF